MAVFGLARPRKSLRRQKLPLHSNLGFLNSCIFPNRDALDATFTAGAVTTPLCPEGGKGPGLKMGSVDLSVMNIGFGFRYKMFGVYLATSVASHTIFSGDSAFSEGLGRGSTALVVPIMAMSYWPVSLFKSDFFRENVSASYTHIICTAVDTPIGPLTAGYATSKGLFTNFTGSKIPLFASALVADRFSDLSYIAGGLSTLRSLASKNWISSVGDTSLIGRKLQFTGLVAPGTSTTEVVNESVKRVPFVTEHLEQSGIGQVFDVTVVGTTAPSPGLYEASLTVHTPGYLSAKSILATLAAGVGERRDSSKPGEGKMGYAVSAGVVRLPDLWFYGVEGGYRFKFGLNANYYSEGDGVISLGIAMNDTEILSVFPYAYNAPQFSALIAGALR